MILCRKCALNFKRRHFKEKPQKLAISNHCICCLVPCISMKLGTFVQWSFLIITNKFARICSNISGDYVMQTSNSGKTRKSGLFLMSRQENLADLFLVFPVRHETRPKAFHSYSLIKCSKNEAFRHSLVNFIKRLPWKR